jgi:hypothetical protein
MLSLKGGTPKVITAAVPSAGAEFAVGSTNHLTVQVTGTTQLYFNADDFAAGQNYLSLGATVSYDGPAAVRSIWLKGSGNATIIAYQRV